MTRPTQTDRKRVLEEALQEAHTALCFLASGMDNPGDSAFARQAADKAERALAAPSPAPAPASRDDVARDAADRLAQVLYGRNAKARDMIGGSDARIFDDAAATLRPLRGQT